MRSSADLHEVVGQDGDSDKHAESFLAVSETTLHAAAAEEHGNAAFDTSAESLSLFEIRAFLKGLTFGSFLSTALRNAGAADASFAAGLLVVGIIEAPIGGEDFGNGTECFSVSLQRGLHMIFIGRIPIQDMVLRD